MVMHFFDKIYDSVIAASLSGAAIYTLIERDFHGRQKILIFLVSFFMGIEGSDTAVSVMDSYTPESIHIGQPMGAFMCSVLIVKIAMIAISWIGNSLNLKGGGKPF